MRRGAACVSDAVNRASLRNGQPCFRVWRGGRHARLRVTTRLQKSSSAKKRGGRGGEKCRNYTLSHTSNKYRHRSSSAAGKKAKRRKRVYCNIQATGPGPGYPVHAVVLVYISEFAYHKKNGK